MLVMNLGSCLWLLKSEHSNIAWVIRVPGRPEVATDLPLIQYLFHTPQFRSVEECITSYTHFLPLMGLGKCHRVLRSVNAVYT